MREPEKQTVLGKRMVRGRGYAWAVAVAVAVGIVSDTFLAT